MIWLEEEKWGLFFVGVWAPPPTPNPIDSLKVRRMQERVLMTCLSFLTNYLAVFFSVSVSVFSVLSVVNTSYFSASPR